MTQMNVYSFNKLEEAETKISSLIIRHAGIIGFITTLLYLLVSWAYTLFSDQINSATNTIFLNLPTPANILHRIGLSESTANYVMALLPFIVLLFLPSVIQHFSVNRAKDRAEKPAREEARRKNLQHFQTTDPHFSVDLAKSEMLMMFKALRLSDPTAYPKIWGVYTLPENRIAMQQAFAASKPAVDILVTDVALDQIWSEQQDTQSRLRFLVNYDALEGRDQRYQLRSYQTAITLARNLHGKTLLLEGEHTAVCPICGAAVQLLNQDTCHYCQTAFHRDELYWRILDISPSADPASSARSSSSGPDGGSRRSTLKDARDALR